MVEETIAWFAGVDWGSAKHQACLLGAQGGIVGEREFPHSGKGLSELADWILSMTGIASAVAVAVEVPHGPVVDVLLDRGFIVHAINPKQLDRLRDRFSIAGAKDDRRDAYVSADGLRTDRHLFRRLQIADPRLIELRAWSRLAEELQEERVRLSNRLHQQLWRYYPQMLKLTDDLTATWLLELWLRAPTPAKAARLRVSADITEGGPNRNRRTEALSRGGTGSSNPLPSTGESKTNPSRPPRCGASKSIVLIAVLSAVPRDRLAWLNGRTRASSAASCPAGWRITISSVRAGRVPLSRMFP